MNRRERLMATLEGRPVDRPPVNFYEINGLDEDAANSDPFNIYSHPSWKPLLDLAREKTERIVMRSVHFRNLGPNPLDEATTTKTEYLNGSRITIRTVQAGGRTLTSRSRRDPDVNTTWVLEPLLKDAEDIRAWLQIPADERVGAVDVQPVLDAERQLGDSGIVMLDTADPLCLAAGMFDLGQFTVLALTEPQLFHRLLEWHSRALWRRTEAVAEALPGRLWRIFGPEYASPPYLPPALFREYVIRYDEPIVRAIQRRGGFARIHCHGKLKAILDAIAETGCTGLDPIEPPPQGDVELAEVRRAYGRQWVLFGNLEASDIENLNTRDFERKVRRAIVEGTSGEGRGFVLMPSACPYGRKLSDLALRNYEKMVAVVEQL
jgi:uroporphyrinogen-III decarboxylase